MLRSRRLSVSPECEKKLENVLCTASLILLAIFSGLLAVAWFLTPH